MSRLAVIRRLVGVSPQAGLSTSQEALISNSLEAFSKSHAFYHSPTSWFANKEFVERFGDFLMLHHAVSDQALSKDKFEHAFAAACKWAKHIVGETPSKTNPGHDVTINNARISLKTQADESCESGSVLISKWMELGKGPWQYNALLQRFSTHIGNYEHILILRKLARYRVHGKMPKGTRKYKKVPPDWLHYQLLEIPKQLLEYAVKYPIFYTTTDSDQDKGLLPGGCYVYGNPYLMAEEDPTKASSDVILELSFDGGSERKLRLRNLDVRFCIQHAEWKIHI